MYFRANAEYDKHTYPWKTTFNLHFKQIKKGGQVSSKKNLSTWKNWTKILIVRYEILSEIHSTLGSSQNVTFTGSQINEARIESLETLLTWIMTYIDLNCSLHVTIYQHFTISVFLNRDSAHNGSRITQWWRHTFTSNCVQMDARTTDTGLWPVELKVNQPS